MPSVVNRMQNEDGGIVLSLHSLPNGRAEIHMDFGASMPIVVAGEAEAMLKSIEATSKVMALHWYDYR